MKRSDFLTKPTPHPFLPSVGEVWRDKRDGRDILLYAVYKPHGFHCVGYNRDCTINFNYLPDDWLKHNVYVKTIGQEEIDMILKSNKERGWL